MSPNSTYRQIRKGTWSSGETRPCLRATAQQSIPGFQSPSSSSAGVPCSEQPACCTTTAMFPLQPTQQSCAELEELGLAELRAHAQDACFHGVSWVASAQESHLLVFGPCSSVSTNVVFSYAWKSYHLISRCLVHRYPVSADGPLNSLQECHRSERRKEVPRRLRALEFQSWPSWPC